MRYLPQTASLFSAIGLPVNLRQLNFENVRIARESEDGKPVLMVDGTIVSASAKPVEVPRLRFAARNPAGQEIYSWTMQPERKVLLPGETIELPQPAGVAAQGRARRHGALLHRRRRDGREVAAVVPGFFHPRRRASSKHPISCGVLGPRLRGDDKFRRAPSPVFFARPRVGRRLPAFAGTSLLPSQSRGDGAPMGRIRSQSAPCGACLRGDGGAPRGAPWRRFRIPGPRFQETPRLLVHVEDAGSTPGRPAWRKEMFEAACPASSSRRGRSAPRSGPGTSRVSAYEADPRAPHRRQAVSRLSAREERCRISGTFPFRRLHRRNVSRRRPSAEPDDWDYMLYWE